MGAYRNDDTLLMEAEKVTGEKWEEPLVVTHREMRPNQETVNMEAAKTLGVLRHH
jgi:hypothetical protein